MEVTVDIKKSDIEKVNFWLALKSRGTYSLIVLVFVALWLYATTKHGLPDTLEDWVVTNIIALVSGIIAAILALTTNLAQILLSSSVSNGVLGFHEYEITESGLYEKTSANETETNWSGIRDISTLRHYMLIQIAPGLFHVIPSTSFENETTFNTFYSTSRKFWENA